MKKIEITFIDDKVNVNLSSVTIGDGMVGIMALVEILAEEANKDIQEVLTDIAILIKENENV